MKLQIPTYRDQVVEFLREMADAIESEEINLQKFQVFPHLEIRSRLEGETRVEASKCEVTTDIQIVFSNTEFENKVITMAMTRI